MFNFEWGDMPYFHWFCHMKLWWLKLQVIVSVEMHNIYWLCNVLADFSRMTSLIKQNLSNLHMSTEKTLVPVIPFDLSSLPYSRWWSAYPDSEWVWQSFSISLDGVSMAGDCDSVLIYIKSYSLSKMFCAVTSLESGLLRGLVSYHSLPCITL